MKFTQTLLALSLSSLSLFVWRNAEQSPLSEHSVAQHGQPKAQEPPDAQKINQGNAHDEDRDPAKTLLLNQQKRAAEREIYRKLQQYLALSQSETTLGIAKALLAQLQDYPLLPYAEYQFLIAKKADLSFDEILDFTKKHPDFPLNNLPHYWLQQQYDAQNWQAILSNTAMLPKESKSSCIVLTAQEKMPSTQTEALTTPEKTAQKNTALATRIKNLWLTGNNSPSQCQTLFMQAYQQGIINDDLIKQRALLAVEKTNRVLINELAAFTQNAELKIWLENLASLLKSPRLLLSSSNAFYVENLPVNDENKQILLALMPRFIKSITENQLNANAPFAQLEQWATRFNLSPEQRQYWQSILLSQLFDSENPAIQQWRDETVQALKEDKQTERRIRVALREKTAIQPWLNLLSEQGKQKDEWRYWQGEALFQQGKTAQATKIWQEMQQNARGFYPMLAAQRLGIAYQPAMKTFSSNKQNLSNYTQQFSRINELQQLNDHANIQREWRALLDNTDFAGKLALAQYAEQNQWVDLQVDATIQAKAWDYIALRLPNAYQNWFDLFINHQNSQKIHRTFAMAIARQESAWRANVTSSANARGLMQLLPSTAKLTAEQAQLPYKKESQLFDPIDNIMLGTTHLNQLAEKYGNNRILIAAAYNAGAKRVDEWLARANGKMTMAEFIATIPFYETRGYVQNVLAYDYYYQLLQGEKAEKFTQAEQNRLY
ncbi:transglycosylase SLT domain-containing protein [Avibacterium sp. 20-129]|uniref:transglycosylase SLT domain-containing protein n=1 Tax=Avibacterium sp. 20-129 TaxID=2911525 RepID=UPI002246E7C9|nr:transglycosylase SLT domain-containing protein [Avibacterium sp. 20-129]MCW9700014.1 transglycosylase SLT domain-containing protein [Avibacterium sp. 20-129]